MNLQDANGIRMVDSKKKTSFIEFVVCIESLRRLQNQVCLNNNSLMYIPTYKISQDHIELFFGCIRSRGGWNNNPTTRQFKAAIQQLLIHSEIRFRWW